MRAPDWRSIKALGDDPQHLYQNDDAGPRRRAREYKRLTTEAQERSKQLFAHAARRRRWKAARAGVQRSDRDPAPYYQGRRWMAPGPGVFFANLRDMKEVQKWGMPTLAYHEGVPGITSKSRSRRS
jgi:uncharacterized protein (DUF885 family)